MEPAADGRPDPLPSPAWPRRLAGLLRLEDALLSVVAIAGLPLLERLTGPGDGFQATSSGTPTALAGWCGLLAIAGVLACLCTRGPGEPPVFGAGELTLQGWARFPLLAGVGIVGVETLPGLGIDPDPFVGITFLVVLVTAIASGVLPVVPVVARRAMVTPMALVATGAFDQIMGGGLGDVLGAAVRGQAPPEMSGFLPLIIGAGAALYTMLVIAPRAIADPGATWLAWGVRFLLLLGSVVVGSSVSGAVS